MGIKYANNATSKLVAGITPYDTSLTVSVGEGDRFPALGPGDWFIATLINAMNEHEIVKVTARSGDSMTIVRAQEGTSAKSFPINSRIELRLTAGAFIQIIEDVRAEAQATISAVVDTIIPIGGIIFRAGNHVPPNFIRPNGAMLSRAAYPRLWEFANVYSNNIVNEAQWSSNPGSFSRGDGSTTFRIPDIRGEFIRVWDEGRGADPSRFFGTWQGSQNASHSHSVWDNGHNHHVNDPGHTHGVGDPGHQHSYTEPGNSVALAPGIASHRIGTQGGTTGKSGTGIVIYGSGTGIWLSTGYANIGMSASGGNESRPRNVAYLALMRYQ